MIFAAIYLVLMCVLVLFSWMASIYGLLLPSGEVVPSLLCNESLRWFVRHGMENVVLAPLAEVMVVLMIVGVLRNSGMLNLLSCRTSMTQRQRHALLVGGLVLGVELCLILLCMLPGGCLLSITGHFHGGPLAQGWLFVTLCVVSLPCIAYAWMGGIWHSPKEAFVGISSEIACNAEYFVTFVVASQFMAAMDYIGLFDLLNWGASMRTCCMVLVYATPLIVTYITKNSNYDTSSTE